MAKYKIEFDIKACIWALSCYSAAPKFWPRSDDGKVDLKGAKYNKDTNTLEMVGNEGRRIGGERKMKRIQTG